MRQRGFAAVKAVASNKVAAPTRPMWVKALWISADFTRRMKLHRLRDNDTKHIQSLTQRVCRENTIVEKKKVVFDEEKAKVPHDALMVCRGIMQD